eukprot:5641685-Alexandrium_andersonii.AAC.1
MPSPPRERPRLRLTLFGLAPNLGTAALAAGPVEGQPTTPWGRPRWRLAHFLVLFSLALTVGARPR